MDQAKPPPSFNEAPLTEEHLVGIGRIIVRWSMTERVVMDSLWEIATGRSWDEWGPEASISLALVTGMDSRVMLGMLRAVFHARHPNDSGDLDKIIDKIEKLGKVRNAIAHGRWTVGQRPRTIETASLYSTGRLRVQKHAFTAQELNSTADRIAHMTWQLANFLQARGYWKPIKPHEESAAPAP